MVAPLMRVSMVATLKRLAQLGSAPVLVPWIEDATSASELLTPLIEQRNTRQLGRKGETSAYEYIGEQYDASARFWVGDDDLLTRYTWCEWDVRLVNFSRV